MVVLSANISTHVQLLKRELQATAELANEQLECLKEEHAAELKALAASHKALPEIEASSAAVATAALQQMCASEYALQGYRR
jgi:hypothetical protein